MYEVLKFSHLLKEFDVNIKMDLKILTCFTQNFNETLALEYVFLTLLGC